MTLRSNQKMCLCSMYWCSKISLLKKLDHFFSLWKKFTCLRAKSHYKKAKGFTTKFSVNFLETVNFNLVNFNLILSALKGTSKLIKGCSRFSQFSRNHFKLWKITKLSHFLEKIKTENSEITKIVAITLANLVSNQL